MMLAAAVSLMAACGSGPGGAAGADAMPPAEPAYLTGAVTQSQPANDGDTLGTLLVEEEPGVQSGNKASTTVVADTLLLRETSEGFAPTDFATVAAAQTVSVWFSGPVAESYPVQGTAAAVVVRDGL